MHGGMQGADLTVPEGVLGGQGRADDPVLQEIVQPLACEVLHTAQIDVVEEAVYGEVPPVQCATAEFRTRVSL